LTGKGKKLTGTPQPTLTESGNQIFGKALAHWLEQTGKGHKEVADRLQVRVSALSHWLAGRKRPGPLRLLRLLIHLHAWLGPDWTVADALDTIAPLGWSWEDVQRALETLQEKEARTFREWWEKGKPQPPPLSPSQLPAWYVEREEQHRLREMLTDWADWRQARWRGIVVTGVAGAGKTTLLFALAQDPSVRRAFRDGILWLEGNKKDLLDQAADRISLVGPPGARREKWAQWAGAPYRRLLIVVDDGLPDEDLDTLAATSWAGIRRDCGSPPEWRRTPTGRRAEGQRSGGAGEPRSGGAREQESRGAGEPRSRIGQACWPSWRRNG
jgi:transcriptional regulator with XRE-family HTH domain